MQPVDNTPTPFLSFQDGLALTGGAIFIDFLSILWYNYRDVAAMTALHIYIIILRYGELQQKEVIVMKNLLQKKRTIAVPISGFVPRSWHIQIASEKELRGLGKENLTLARAYWRKREKDLKSAIIEAQRTVDCARQGSFPEAWMKKPVEDHGKCSNCKHMVPLSCLSALKVFGEPVACSCCSKLLSFKLDGKIDRRDTCHIATASDKLRKKVIKRAERLKNNLVQEKALVAKKIELLGPLIDEADHAPVLPVARTERNFHVEDSVLLLMENGIYPGKVVMRPALEDEEEEKAGIPVLIDFPERKSLMYIKQTQPRLMLAWDFEYLKTHPGSIIDHGWTSSMENPDHRMHWRGDFITATHAAKTE